MNPIPMRRHRQQLSQQQSINLLESSTSGTLSLNQPDGFPYQVPLSYVYTDGKLYFHCAQSGYKLDLLRQDDRAGFCVIAQDRICPERYTMPLSTVSTLGKLPAKRIVEQPDEKMDAVRKLCARYVPLDSPQSHQQTIDKEWSSLCILCFEIEQMSGKQALELCQ